MSGGRPIGWEELRAARSFLTVVHKLNRTIRGRVVAVGSGLLAISQYHDFYLEGVCVLPAGSVLDAQPNNILQQVVLGEGLDYNDADFPRASLDSFGSFFLSLAASGDSELITLTTDEEGEGDGFYVGAFDRYSHDSIHLLELLVDGTWDDQLTEVKVARVQSVELQTPYSRLLAKCADGGYEVS